jgi:hypothetical protein
MIPSSIREPPKVSYVLKLMGKYFIDPKSSEILPINLSLDIPALLKSWKKHYMY